MFPRPLSALRALRALCFSLAAGWLGAALLVSAAAFAEEAAAPPLVYEGFDGTVCEADFLLHCSGKFTEGAAYTCLRQMSQRDALKPACAKLTDEIRLERHARAVARQRAWLDGCEGDIPKFCAQYADAKPMTVKGCLSKRRSELSQACNENLPIRANLGASQKGTPSRARWRDGTEPADWALENALRDRPRKTQEEIDEIGRDAWIARDDARREKKIARGIAQRAAKAAADLAAAEGEDAAE